MIVALAISDRMTLVSSDSKFTLYKAEDLDFLYNRR